MNAKKIADTLAGSVIVIQSNAAQAIYELLDQAKYLELRHPRPYSRYLEDLPSAGYFPTTYGLWSNNRRHVRIVDFPTGGCTLEETNNVGQALPPLAPN